MRKIELILLVSLLFLFGFTSDHKLRCPCVLIVLNVLGGVELRLAE